MASLAVIQSQLGGIPAAMKTALIAAFGEVLKTGKIRFGRTGEAEACENMAGHFYEFTTASVANQEFVIAHKFGRPPYALLPALNLLTVNSTTPPLTVTRAADSAFVYLSSSETDVTGCAYIEG